MKEIYPSPAGVKTRSRSQGDHSEPEKDDMTMTPRGRAKSRGTPRGGGSKSSSNPGDIRTRPNAHTEVPSGQRLSQQGPPLADVQPTEPQAQEAQDTKQQLAYQLTLCLDLYHVPLPWTSASTSAWTSPGQICRQHLTQFNHQPSVTTPSTVTNLLPTLSTFSTISHQ